MKQLGSTLLVFGIGMIVLEFIGRDFVILQWIDSWGVETGLGIRAAMIVCGAALLLLRTRHVPPPRSDRRPIRERNDGYADPLAELFNRPAA